MTPNNLFYISSLGHSASGWLQDVLNKHPQIVTFHGCRSFPPIESGKVDDTPVDEFSESLSICTKGTYHKKLFGAIHGYYGSIAKDSTIKSGGLFSSIIRDPIKRINSLYYSSNLKYFKSHADLWDSMQELPFDQLPTKMVNGHISDAELPSDASYNFKLAKKLFKSFRNLTGWSLSIDNDCFKNCDPKKILIMEEMTKSREYFIKIVWPCVTNYLDLNSYNIDEMLNPMQKENHINNHTGIYKSSKEIYDVWPKCFKRVFSKLFYQDGDNTKKMFENYSYNVFW
jgi:hypothetical protein